MRYALRNLVRLKVRSFLTFIIAFAILFLSMFGVMVLKVCEDNRERFYGPLDGSVHVTNENYEPCLTYEAAMALCENAEIITVVSAVKEYIGIFEDCTYVGYGTFKRERYSGEDSDSDGKVNYVKGISVVGVTDMNILEEVYRGDLTMIDGTMIMESNNEAHHNKIVISEELAEQNGLSLGDTLILDMPSLYRTEFDVRFYAENGTKEADKYVYIVGGIFENIDNTANVSLPWEVNANRVYVPVSTLSDIAGSERIQTLYSYTTVEVGGKILPRYGALHENPSVIPDRLYFHLSNIHEMKNLEKEINTLGFYETILLTEYVSDSASSPSARLSEIVSIILFGIGCVGFVIFGLAILFNMKTRHKELAVLVALGKSRRVVTLSFFIEISLLVMVAVLASGAILIITTDALAIPITNYLYSAEISAKWSDISSDMILFENGVENMIATQMADMGYLFHTYALPSFLWVLCIILFVMILIYLFVRIYVSKINALSDVGGKE